MKQIEEEWKVIEEFPNYEISNMGQCRNVERGWILRGCKRPIMYKSKMYVYLIYNLSRREGGAKAEEKKTALSLVAEYFVPNPHGFKFARFKDGNGTNCIYTNIEWVENLNPGFLNSKAHLEKTKWPKRTKEEMFKYIEETIEQLNMQKEAIKDNRIAEYVTGYATDILRSIYSRYATSRNRKWMRDAYIEYAQDVMLKKFNNGYPIAIFSSFFIVTYREFRSWCRKRKREVEYKDEITYNGWEDIENQQF